MVPLRRIGCPVIRREFHDVISISGGRTQCAQAEFESCCAGFLLGLELPKGHGQRRNNQSGLDEAIWKTHAQLLWISPSCRVARPTFKRRLAFFRV